jgi:GTP-binding protein
VEIKDTAEYIAQIRRRLKFMPHTPILFVSAKLGSGVNKILPTAREIWRQRQRRLPTSALNSLITEVVAAHSPPPVGGRRLNILYATQAGVNPPTIVFFVNDAKLVHFSYKRYLVNSLRQAFGFTGTPLRLHFKGRGEA